MKDGKHVVLCIDDDEDILDTLKTILEANGYVTATAPSAEEGLKLYKEVSPDFIIVDLMMEEIDAGTGFAKELQRLDNKAPVFMLSSVGNDLSNAANYQDLGLDGVLQKPITPDSLLSILKTKLK